jgi:hypothetical protein
MRRLLLLLMALAVAGSPVVRSLCQLACVSTSAHSAHGSAEHASRDGSAPCHDEATTGSRVSQAPHACAHDSDLAPAASLLFSQENSRAVDLGVAAAVIVFLPPLRAHTGWDAEPAYTPQAAGLSSAVPLRI